MKYATVVKTHAEKNKINAVFSLSLYFGDVNQEAGK
jgi:hypothetical protein